MALSTLAQQKLLAIAAFILLAQTALGQVMIDSKNITEDNGIEYFQLMYYVDQKTFKPVYMIDYGVLENSNGPVKAQRIRVNNEEIKDSMSPVYVINKLHRAGWEYMGDAIYVKMPLMENLVTYTFKRKMRK